MNIWTTNDKRRLRITEIDLDHLINIVNDCVYRVAAMKHQGLRVLGGPSNVNVNRKTLDAFTDVRPIDVFPAFDTLVTTAKRRFFQKFGLTIDEVHSAIMSAWLQGESIDGRFEDAVRFYLIPGRAATTLPMRLVPYLRTLDVDTPASYASMCWNLRIDQRDCWARMTRLEGPPLHRMVKTIPETRLNSALRFAREIDRRTFDPTFWPI